MMRFVLGKVAWLQGREERGRGGGEKELVESQP